MQSRCGARNPSWRMRPHASDSRAPFVTGRHLPGENTWSPLCVTDRIGSYTISGKARIGPADARRADRCANGLKRVPEKGDVMDLRRIVTRSGQAFKSILDPNTDLVSRAQLSEFEAIKRQLATQAQETPSTRQRATAKKAASASKATAKSTKAAGGRTTAQKAGPKRKTSTKTKRSPRTRQA